MAKSFSADLAAFARKANMNVDNAYRGAAIMVAAGIINASPVDTGRFRHNWQFGISVPLGRLDGFDKPGNAVLARIISQIGNTQAGGIVYMANNLPYALELERGSSKKAPTGVVGQTLINFESYVRQVVAGMRI